LAKEAKLDHEIRMTELTTQQAQLGEGEKEDGQTPSEPRREGNLVLETVFLGTQCSHNYLIAYY